MVSLASSALYNQAMHNQLHQQLAYWYPRREQHQWVLGCVYKVEGPSYRKPGAMMFFNDLGEQLGLLSGGCLESDIQKHASRVMRTQQAVTLCYDGTDEDDMSVLLGIGCGGTVYILLQPLTEANDYLNLTTVAEDLTNRQASIFLQKITEQHQTPEAQYLAKGSKEYLDILARIKNHRRHNGSLIELDNQNWLATHIKPPTQLLIVGGGVDARPLADIASTLGWEVSVCDPRPANARREHFMSASHILRCSPQALPSEPLFNHFDAAVVMSHNLQLDADALAALQKSSVKYLALLGPAARKQQVLALGGLQPKGLSIPIAGPAGLNLGGELPEDIALSIMAECLAKLNQVEARSISELL